MSSTNRKSNFREKHISDYYLTPISKIQEFLTAFSDDCSVFQDEIYIVDPCAGGDANHPMSYPTAIREIYPWQTAINTIDIREDSLAGIKEDYLSYEFDCKAPRVIITNPPFNLALPIIKKAISDVAEDGYVIMLLRLNFFGSKERFQFFENNMPEYAYVHHRRISFVEGGGATDSIEYMHAVWHKGVNPRFTKLRVI